MNLLEFFGLKKLSVSWGPLDDRWYSSIVGRGTTAGVAVDEETAKNYSAVWAATRLLAGTGGALPLNLNRQLAGGGKAVARNHATHRVLHFTANPRMGSMQFRALGINRQVNHGNFYAEIARDALGRVAALWPIHPSRIPKGAEEDRGELVYQVKNDDGSQTRIPADQMFHVPSIITKDGVNGIGVITAARESIGFGLATERHGAAYFGNGARPSVALRHPGVIKDKEYRDELRRTWNTIHQGPHNAGKVALLQEGMDVSILSISAEDAQFLQTRQHNVEEVARWYGVPPHMIGHLLRSTYNNIEVQNIEFVVYSLLPWLVLWEQEIYRKLLTPEEQSQGLYAKHVLDGLLRGDTPARSAFYKAMWEIGVFSENDILELEDRNPIGPDGDKRFVPANFQLLATAGQEPPAAPTPPAVSQETPGDEGDEDPGLLQVIADRCGNLVAAQATLHLDVIGAVEAAFREQRLEVREERADSPQPLTPNPQPPGAALAAAYAALDATVQRMLSKEQNAARRAAARSGAEFFQWLDPFYEKHRELLAAACLAPVRVILALEGNAEAAEEYSARFAAAHVEQSRRELLSAMECPEAELTNRVESTLDAWRKTRRVVFTGPPQAAAA